MLKKLKYSLLVFVVYLLLPCYVFATEGESDAVANGEESFVDTTTAWDCETKQTAICQSDYVAGVRFTFIYQDGSVASGSYDFTTVAAGGQSDMLYNIGEGNKSKLSGSLNLQQTNVWGLKKLSELTARVKYYITNSAEYKAGKVANIGLSGNTGGNKSNAFAIERSWFKSLTENGIQRETYIANINAFVDAIHDSYPSFNATDMKMKIQEGCHAGKEIFIQMEPLYTVYHNPDGAKRYIFGSVRDIVTYFAGLDQTEIHWGSRSIDYMNEKGYLKAIKYDEKIKAPKFTGFKPHSTFKLQNAGDVNTPDGYAVALDWASSPEGYCYKCTFVNSVMKYDDNYLAGPYPSLDGDAKKALVDYSCCSALINDYTNNRLNNRWKEAYERYCSSNKQCDIIGNTYYCQDGKSCDKTQWDIECGPGGPNPQCCTEDLIKAGEIEGVVANCCVETTHSYVKEHDLEQLFCNHQDLHVNKYWAKCDTDEYKTEINEYCDMYCTERVSIDIPQAITAKSGRYFTLSKNPNPDATTTSPYIEGIKRCRMIIKYNKWEDNYKELVKKQVEAFNDYQKNAAILDSYNKLLSNLKDESETAYVNCTASASLDMNLTGTITPAIKEGAKSSCESSGGTLVEENGKYKCNKSKTNRVESCEIKYKSLKSNTASSSYITASYSTDQQRGFASINSSRPSSESLTETNSVLDIDASDCSSKANEKKGDPIEIQILGTDVYTTYDSCNYATSLTDNGLRGKKANAQKEYNKAKSALQEKIGDANGLKRLLNECNNYFAENKDKEYKFDPTMTFKYSQIYRDDNGRSILDEMSIPFLDTPGCKLVSLDEGQNIAYDTNAYDTVEDRYSPQYPGLLKIKDFTNYDLNESYNKETPITSFNLIQFDVNRRFTHDARYKVVCEWEEAPNRVNTLTPNGAVTENATANFTVHEREYRVFLTTYDGTYQTEWKLTNVGENGKFDKYFQNSGKYTCSGQQPSSDETFTCTLHIGYEIVYTGKCNGITKNPDDCDPVDDVSGFFQFKVADPTNLFPTGTTAEDGKPYAKNWTDTSKGLAAKEKIEEDGAKGETYAKHKITYQVKLKPRDMGLIKNYNVTRNSNQRGGFSDFEMTCNCPTEPQTNTANGGGVGCTQCKSKFLDDLVEGRIRYDGQTHQVNVWTANKSLEQVRNDTWR